MHRKGAFSVIYAPIWCEGTAKKNSQKQYQNHRMIEADKR